MAVEKFERGKKYQVHVINEWYDAVECYPVGEDRAMFPFLNDQGTYSYVTRPLDSPDVREKPKGRYKITFEDFEDGGEATTFWADGYEVEREPIRCPSSLNPSFEEYIPGPAKFTAWVICGSQGDVT